MGATVSFPCQRANYNNTTLYVMLCKASDLFKLVKVNRKVEDKEEGYQRAFSTSRAKAIGRYIKENGVIPGSIIVTFDEATYDETTKSLLVPETEDAGWVIDGQHRLEGAAIFAADKDIYLPVTAFVNLPETVQIDLFVTINKEQKGVSSSLYIELLKKLPNQLSEPQALQERTADLAHILKNDPDSPFFKRIISTASPKLGQISMTNFVRKVSPLIKSTGPLSAYPDETRAGILSNAYHALLELHPGHQDIFFKTIAFGAIMNAFQTIHQLILMIYGTDFTVTTFNKLFRSIDFDFRGLNMRGTGNNAEILAGKDLRDALLRANPVKLTL